MTPLEQENKRLEKTLQELRRRIEDNQQIQSHFQEFESQVFHCDTLSELFDKILLDSLTHFRLDSVSILLNDSDHHMRTLAERMRISNYNGRLQFFHHPLVFNQLFAHPPVARLGALETSEVIRLFPQGTRIKSSALLPLVRHNKVMGCINFGSVDAERFTPDKSADFLDHLAMVIAVCLENGFGLESLRQQSLIDVLTQVYNRRSFEIELGRELSRAARHNHRLSCLFIDIDHFKTINDTYGHQSGDECLRQVAQHIKELLRKTDVFARYGGEEFVALMPEANLDHAQQTAERIREAIAGIGITAENGGIFQLTLSIGVSSHHFTERGEIVLQTLGENLLSKADQAMYEAKRSGRNKVCLAQ